MSSWWDDLWGTVKKEGEKAGEQVGDVTGISDVAGAFSSLNDSVSFAKAVWLNVSDYRMWRSLGWLLLGIVLMFVGFLVWNRKALEAVSARVPV